MEWTIAIGVDTHKATHTAVALDRVGVQLGSVEIETTSAGYLRLLQFAQELGEPAFALEGSGSYGAGLARFLLAAGLPVFEVERPSRRERRRGKNDLLDAAHAAGRLVSGQGLSGLRGGGGGPAREDLRLLLLERRGAIRAHTAALNQLHAIVLTGPTTACANGSTGCAATNSSAIVCACAPAATATRPSPASCDDSHAAPLSSPPNWTSSKQSWNNTSPRSPPNCSNNAASARSALHNSSSPAETPNACATKPLSPRSPAPAPSRPPAARPAATGSTVAATDNSTPPSTSS